MCVSQICLDRQACLGRWLDMDWIAFPNMMCSRTRLMSVVDARCTSALCQADALEGFCNWKLLHLNVFPFGSVCNWVYVQSSWSGSADSPAILLFVLPASKQWFQSSNPGPELQGWTELICLIAFADEQCVFVRISRHFWYKFEGWVLLQDTDQACDASNACHPL